LVLILCPPGTLSSGSSALSFFPSRCGCQGRRRPSLLQQLTSLNLLTFAALCCFFLGLGGHILELRKLKTNYTNQLILYIILLCEKTCELLRETLI
jgi:hypothetical protein